MIEAPIFRSDDTFVFQLSSPFKYSTQCNKDKLFSKKKIASLYFSALNKVLPSVLYDSDKLIEYLASFLDLALIISYYYNIM